MAEKGDGSKMPPWRMPSPMGDAGMLNFWDRFFPLRVYNSLTRSKVRFVPKNGRRVLWYMCGPTVYASSHMGHARTYLHFDILRRIMTDFFGYQVYMCMCITDIDDKIITRSREAGQHFRELASFFEDDFMLDMAALGVKHPEVVTRVSESMDDIIKYVEEIVANGYGYEANGSVYFDVAAYHKTKNHAYGKLVPESVGNGELLAEGEGALGCNVAADKRGPSDFALWKKAKADEPSWESPWGPGRPGWHIECSAMASRTFEAASPDGADGRMDIHSGGVDLRFPHHDNELAQSEAKYDTGSDQWVNYFLHTGHLHIKGFKMSKSLKNFITIKEALRENSPRQVRLLGLLHKYNAPMDYGDDTMTGALATEKIYMEFFHNVKAALRKCAHQDSLRLEASEQRVMRSVDTAQDEVHTALCDDFDTPRAMRALQEVVRVVNKYMDDKEAAKAPMVRLVLRRAAEYVTRMFKIFGVISSGDEMGFSAGGSEGFSREDALAPLLNVLAEFREAVRAGGRAGDMAAVLAACDDVRDNLLPPVGVRLEDKGSEVVWKLEDPAVLMREREAKEMERKKKEDAKLEKAQKDAERAEKEKVPPSDWFRRAVAVGGGAGAGDPKGAAAVPKPLYSRFDDKGIPTHDAAGEPLGGGAVKKLAKEWEAHRKLHQRYLDRLAKAGGAAGADAVAGEEEAKTNGVSNDGALHPAVALASGDGAW